MKHGKPGGLSGARSGRWLIYLLMSLAAVAVLASAALAWRGAVEQDQASRIGPDVKVGDLSLGGMTVAQAEQAISQRYAAIQRTQLTLSFETRSWSFTAEELGVAVDAQATARQAHEARRGDVVAAESIAKDVPLVFTHDREMARAALAVVAGDLAVTPVDAELKISSAEIAVVPSREGRELDIDATLDSIEGATAAFPFGSARIVTTKLAPALHETELEPAAERASTMASEPLTLILTAAEGEPQRWVLQPEQLRRMLVVSKDSAGKPVVDDKLNEKQLKSFVQGIAPQIKRESSDATLLLPDYGTEVKLTPHQVGRELDVDATVERLHAAAMAEGAQRTVEPVVTEQVPPVTTEEVQPVKDGMDRVLRDGIKLIAGDKSYQIPAEQVVLKLYLEKVPGADPPYRPLVYDADMGDLALAAGKQLNARAEDAMYRLVNGQVSLARPPKEGYKVDVEATAANIRTAFLEGKVEAELVGAPLAPTFGDAGLTAISTPDLLDADSTFYGNSSAERNWNVTLGAERLDGWYVPPGAVFSVNEALGPLTLEAGYKMGWGIINQGGSVTTIPSEAGGICQVVTTLFHPLFWVGVPFTERHHHSYWIEKYGIAPKGLPGLDATIDPPWSDLKFKNTTGNWLLIRVYGDTKNVKAEVWGTRTGWRVDVSKPVITDVVKADTKMHYEENDKVPAGKRIQVETAQDGFNADIRRRVYDAAGNLIDDWHAKSRYLPARNVTVVGTGKDVAP